MKLKIDLNVLGEHPRNFIRRCGYGEIYDRLSKQTSYVKRLSSSYHYPRFHLYFKVKDDVLIIDLHLDEKKAMYEGQAAHNAQYDSPQVKAELERIAQFVNTSKSSGVKKEKSQSLFKRLFKKD